METWVPLAVVSMTAIALWARRCRADAAGMTDGRSSEHADFNDMGSARLLLTDAPFDGLGETNSVTEGPPEAWKRMFLDPLRPEPERAGELYSQNAATILSPPGGCPQASSPRRTHQHGMRPIRLVRSQRG